MNRRRRRWLDALDAATSVALYLWVLVELQRAAAEDAGAAYERGRHDEHERMAHTLIRDHKLDPPPLP